jgi:hypothetical protein
MNLLLLLILIAVGGLPLLIDLGAAMLLASILFILPSVILFALALAWGPGTPAHCASSAKPGTMLTSEQFMRPSCG